MIKWLVFASALFVNYVSPALLYSIGSIFVDVMETFRATRAETGAIQSTGLSVGFILGTSATFIIPKIGIRKSGVLSSTFVSVGIILSYLATRVWHLIVSFGIIYAFGMMNLYICCITAVSRHFKGRIRPLVLSLQCIATGCGCMSYPYILTYLSFKYGFRGALLIIGGVCLNCIPSCLLWVEPNTHRTSRISERLDSIVQYQTEFKVVVTEEDDGIVVSKKKPKAESEEQNDIFYIRHFPVMSHRQTTRRVSISQEQNTQSRPEERRSIFTCLKALFSNRKFVHFCIASNLVLSLLQLTPIYIADIFRDKRLSQEDTVFGLLLLNAFNVIGRITPGALIQIECVPVLFGPFLAILLAVCAMTGIILAKSRLVVLLFCALTGLPTGMLIAMFSVISVWLVGEHDFPAAMGIMVTTYGIINALVGPVSGHLRDVVGSYDIPFYVAITVAGFSAFLMMFTLIQQRRETSRVRPRVFYVTSM